MNASEELWISRAVDGRAGVEDWRGLHRVAATDPDVWRRLCATLEAETELRVELAAVVPQDVPTPAPAAQTPAQQAPLRPGPDVRLYGLLAALLALTFVVGRWTAIAPAIAPAGGDAMPAAGQTPDQLMQAYLREGATAGRVIDQLPLQTLSTRRAPDGDGFDVVFVRSLVERARVKQLMTLAPDEHGSPQPLQIDLADYIPPTEF